MNKIYQNALTMAMLLMFAVMGCSDDNGGMDGAYDNRPTWINMDTIHYPDTSVYIANTSVNFSYPVGLEGRMEYSSSMQYRNSTITRGTFEIIGNVKPFSEWQECNIKLPFDTTKNWFFRYEGKNIPKNISFLHNKSNMGDTLVFWDSVDNIKYYFKKIMENDLRKYL